MIELTDWLRSELTRRAEQEAPQEACGLISAPNGRTKGSRPGIGLWAARNAAEAPETSFLIAPQDQTAILKQIWGRGEDLVGLYHSHPRQGPEPSERDRAIAAAIQSMRPSSAPALTWVIVGKCQECFGTGIAGFDLSAPRPAPPQGFDVRLPPMVDCPACEGDSDAVDFWIGELP